MRLAHLVLHRVEFSYQQLMIIAYFVFKSSMPLGQPLVDMS